MSGPSRLSASDAEESWFRFGDGWQHGDCGHSLGVF